MCELCEPQCICVAAGVAVVTVARISVVSHGDTGLWEESVPHRLSCIQLHHELSSFLSFSQEVILDLSERPSTLYIP